MRADTTMLEATIARLEAECRQLRQDLGTERRETSRLRARLAAAEGALAGRGAAWERLQRDAARTTLLERRCALLEARVHEAYRLNVWGSAVRGARVEPPAS
jgi:hypothetical protein